MKYILAFLVAVVTIFGPSIAPETIYTVYIPLMEKPLGGKGVSLADTTCVDLATVNATWYHTFGETDTCIGQTSATFIPMVIDTSPNACYSEMAFLGELDPSNSGDPILGAQNVSQYMATCPDTFVVLGGVGTVAGLAWLQTVIANIPNFDGGVGIMLTCDETADDCLTFLDQAVNLGWPVWVTSMSIFHTYDTPQEVTRLLSRCEEVALRCAWYTNRVIAGDPWADREFYLFENGELTPVGIAYRDNP